MKIRFTKYLHDEYQYDENVGMLTAAGLSADDADHVASQRPWYEVALSCEFDTETRAVTIVGWATPHAAW